MYLALGFAVSNIIILFCYLKLHTEIFDQTIQQNKHILKHNLNTFHSELTAL